MGNVVANGKTWAKVRMDYTYFPPFPCPPPPVICDGVTPIIRNRFNIDINDNLFTPGDTISYFFSATSLDGTTYYSTATGSSGDINTVAANPMELTILPAGGYRRGGNILYVDGADDTNTNVYYDGVFQALLMRDKVDRFDIRASGTGGLAARVKNVAAQLNGCYRAILWDTGSLSITLGDGTGTPIKADDYALLNNFLGNLTSPGGVILAGDRLAESLNGYAGASAVTFRSTYMPFTLINGNHRKAPTSFQISPTIVPWPGRLYDDSFVLFGGCPELNDFDVIGASGTSRVEMSYNTASNANGAVVSNTTGNAHVIMAGFSVAYIRDNELDGSLDRAVFVYRSLNGLGFPQSPIDPVTGHALRFVLAQNYPNPFNPTTTIEFSLAHREHVNLRVYDVSGALVRVLADDERAAGAYSASWDGRDSAGSPAASGVYFYKLDAGDFTQTRKMVLLK
jgi:hypothetical protein